MKTITLTEDQARIVLQSLEITNRAGNLNDSRTLLTVHDAIVNQLNAPLPLPSVPTDET